MSHDTALRAVFGLLDQWRHLPGYQLERRVDVFFASIIRDYIQEHDRVLLQPEVLPEFPIRTAPDVPIRDNFQSDRVDFAMFSQDRSIVYLVELKTDMASIRPHQHTNLSACERRPFGDFLQDILDNASRTKERGKYHYLLHALAKAGFLELPSELSAFTFPPKRGYSQRLRDIRVRKADSHIVACYVQPRVPVTDRLHIDFTQLAEFLRPRGDQFSLEFAQLLDRWCEAPALAAPVKPTPPAA